MKQTFDYQDGKLCLKTFDTMTDEPIAIVAHYSFGDCYQTVCEHLIGKDAHSQGNGVYSAYVDGRSLDFRLESGGQTKPFKFEKVSVDPPKTKRKTRWHYGKWEALFATGWRTP